VLKVPSSLIVTVEGSIFTVVTPSVISKVWISPPLTYPVIVELTSLASFISSY
jgi:hypothetical protein